MELEGSAMRVHIIRDLAICADCAQVIANDEWSWLDATDWTEEGKADRAAEIIAGIDRELPYNWVVDVGEPFFSWQSCECCDNGPGGERLPASLVFTPTTYMPAPGVLVMNTEGREDEIQAVDGYVEIQRDDSLSLYDSDEDAAKSLGIPYFVHRTEDTHRVLVRSRELWGESGRRSC